MLWAYFWLVSPFAAYAAYLAHIGQDRTLMWAYIGFTAFLILSPLRLYRQARRMERFVAQVAAQRHALSKGRDRGSA
jgi:uncharacterized membrane protein (UPF0136 family)